MSDPRRLELEGTRRGFQAGDVEGRRQLNRDRLREIARIEGVTWLLHEVQVIAAWATYGEN